MAFASRRHHRQSDCGYSVYGRSEEPRPSATGAGRLQFFRAVGWGNRRVRRLRAFAPNLLSKPANASSMGRLRSHQQIRQYRGRRRLWPDIGVRQSDLEADGFAGFELKTYTWEIPMRILKCILLAAVVLIQFIPFGHNHTNP